MENSATNGLENTDNVVIDRKKFIKLLNRQCRLEYMLTLLGAICYSQENKVRPDTRGRMRNLGDRLYCI